MTAERFLRELESEGVQLWAETDELRFRAPHGVMTDERRASLRREKLAILALLRGRQQAPRVPRAPELAHQPFPLTDVQAAYLLGRGHVFEYGGVGCHGYGELFFTDLDPQRVQAAFRKLVHRHAMLRAVVAPDGTQRVLVSVPEYGVEVLDLRARSSDGAQTELEALRATMDHRVYEPSEWPLFDLRVTLLPGGALLHVSLDLLIADFVSTQILLEELADLYDDPELSLPDLTLSFRDYTRALQELERGEQYQHDREYWLARLETLPPAPELPVLGHKAGSVARFQRKQLKLDATQWQALCTHAGKLGITPSVAVLAAYARALERWCARPRFTLNLTLQNRLELDPEIRRLVGDFTALELLEVDFERSESFAAGARALQEQLWTDLGHRLFSGSQLMREIARRQRGAGALFPIVFTSSIGVAIREDGAAKGLGELHYGITQTPQVWIDCQAMESRDGLLVNWDVRAGLFHDGVVDAMFEVFERLLSHMAEGDAIFRREVSVELPVEQAASRLAANATLASVPEGLLHTAILARAEREPARIAVIGADATLSFGELVAGAKTVCATLEARDIPPGSLVAIALEKGACQTVAALGILLAGCTYVPLDVEHPPARRRKVAEDAGVRAVIVHEASSSTHDWPSSVQRIGMGELEQGRETGFARPRAVSPDEPAYVIYTSGSTGTPKGVVVSHRSALNTILDINRRFGVRAEDRVLGLSALGFDLSVYDLFGPLAEGGCLVLPSHTQRASVEHWIDLVERHQITLWNSVPAQAQMMCDYLASTRERRIAVESIRIVLLSGDWIPIRLPDQLREFIAGVSVISLGGATEAAIWSVFHRIEDVAPEWTSIPYGRPLSNQTFHVLDSRLRPCPDWVTGELYIGGAGLALGYHRDAEKTAERFIRHPVTRERLYKTGDLGRYVPDGSIEFLGRVDRQVKVRGHRIELAEIEAALTEHPSVAGATVIVDGHALDRQLVAFVETARVAVPSEPPRNALLRCDRDAATEARARTFAQYETHADALDRAALGSLGLLLIGLGLSAREPRTGTELQSACAPELVPLVCEWLQVLRASRLVAEGLNGWTLSASVGELRERHASWEVVVKAAGTVAEQSVAKCARAFWQTLLAEGTSRVVASSVLTCGQELLVQTQSQGFLAQWARGIAAEVISELATESGGVRVLELGAASPLKLGHPELAGDARVQTTVTDVSPVAVERVRADCERLGCRCAIYDPAASQWGQGLTSNCFDAVYAQNTLHGARDLRGVLTHIRELLAPGGYLVLAEMTRERPAITTALNVMSALMGGRTSSAGATTAPRGRTLLGADEWRSALVDAGGEVVAVAPAAQDPAALSGMRVFVARFKADRENVAPRELHDFIVQRLPSYMVPAKIQVLDSFPLTANAKIDHEALRAFAYAAPAQPPRVNLECATELDTRLLALFGEVLEREITRTDQGFLELGGNSLRASRLTARLRESVPEAKAMFFDELLREILSGASVAELSDRLTRDPPGHEEPAVSPTATCVREIGGREGPVWVLVHDSGGGLDAYGALPQRLTEQGRVVALVLDDAALYVTLGAQRLIEETAAAFLDELIDRGHLSVRIIGLGGSSLLALEVARQMLEAGGLIESLIAIAPEDWNATLAGGGNDPSDRAVVEHMLDGLRAYEPAVYAGDALVLTEEGVCPADVERTWRALCLGSVRTSSTRLHDPSALVAQLVSAETGATP